MADPGGDMDPDTIARLMSATGCDADQARFLLEAANGNFESARHMFLDAMGAGPLGARPAAPSTATPRTPPRPLAPYARQQTAAPPAAAAAARRPAPGPAPLPLRILWAGFGIMGSLVRLGFRAAATVGDLLLPAALMRVAREIAAALLPGPVPEPDAAGQAQQFIQEFRARYGEVHPEFLPVSFREAAAAAHRELKFLLVYLHSSQHEDSDKFCRSVLCAPELVQETQQQFVCWGGDVRHSDAFLVAGRCQVATYPTVALLSYSGTQLITCVQGYCPLEQLLGVLRLAVAEQGAVLVAERAERQERELSRQILAEQNAEFEASLAADRAREAAQAEQRRKAAEEAAARAAEEEAARAQAEAAERRRLETIASIDRRRAQAAAALPPEPSDEQRAAFIRVRLPDGSNHQRRFAAGNSVEQLYSYVNSLPGCTFAKYSLVCGFPRKVYGADTRQQTLEEAGLVPQGVLFVQPEDEEEDEEQQPQPQHGAPAGS